jgi:hypothetical protein
MERKRKDTRQAPRTPRATKHRGTEGSARQIPSREEHSSLHQEPTMSIFNEEEEGPGHNQLEWAKVRKRAILKQITMDDWEKANNFQRQILHQIELAILSVENEN